MIRGRFVLAALAGVGVAGACTSFGTNTSSIGAIDGGATVDAADATSAVDAGSSFCATQDATFCADFDESEKAESGWDASDLCPAGCTLEESSTVSRSPPHSLHAAAAVDDGTAVATLETDVTLSGRLTLDFDVWFPSVPTAYSSIASAALSDVGGLNNLIVYANTSELYFQLNEEGVPTPDISPSAATPSTTKWHHITMVITTTASSTLATGTFDGASLWTEHPVPFHWPPGTRVRVSVGVVDLFQVRAGDLFVDNVVITSK